MALAVGRVDVDALLSEMPVGLLDEWYEYYRLEPWGDEWERTAIGATTVANEIRAISSAFGGGKFQPLEIDMLIPYRCEEARSQETEAAIAALDAMTGI